MSVGKTKNEELAKQQLVTQIQNEIKKLRFEIKSYDLKVNQIKSNISYQEHEIEILQYNKAMRQANIVIFNEKLKKIGNQSNLVV